MLSVLALQVIDDACEHLGYLFVLVGQRDAFGLGDVPSISCNYELRADFAG